MQQRPTFEDAFGELADTVARLEQGGLTLDESLERFERGIELYRECERMLTEAELRVTRLLDDESLDLPAEDDLEAEVADADADGSEWG